MMSIQFFGVGLEFSLFETKVCHQSSRGYQVFKRLCPFLFLFPFCSWGRTLKMFIVILINVEKQGIEINLLL